jgi:oligoribonuclease (3'-5' exoribonuclease)
MRTHSDIVAAADRDKIAGLCGASIHTVRSWGQRNSIPAEHWPIFIQVDAASLEELAAGVKPRRKAGDEPQQAAAA